MPIRMSAILCGLLFYIVLATAIISLAVAENNVTDIIINPAPPIFVVYDGKQVEVTEYSIINIRQRVHVNACLVNHTNTCIELWPADKLYISSISFNGTLFLIASDINTSIKVLGVKRIKYASGEGLIISIRLLGVRSTESVVIKSALKISNKKSINITSLTTAKLEEHNMYIYVNYDKGRLPFIEFNNGDVIKILLGINNNTLEFVVLLQEFKESNHNEVSMGQPYTRIPSNTTQLNSIANNTENPPQRPGSPRFIQSDNSHLLKAVLNPLFIVATVLLIVSLILMYRVNNSIGK